MDVRIAPKGGLPDASSAFTAHAFAQLACLTCRTHKLKCDRQKPSCSRCSKTDDKGKSCVYPKSRRKPGSQYRNVKELEARLAHVEALLNDTGRRSRRPANVSTPPDVSGSSSAPLPLVKLAILGSLSPSDIDELHRHYFETQPAYIPIIHAGRYLAAYRSTDSSTHPPAALQYAIWTLSAQSHERLSVQQDSLYRRARQQLEADELQGSQGSGKDDDFVTVAHAQAWMLLAIYEARNLSFSRAAMSCSRCVRLVSMLGLDQLDADTTKKGASVLPLPPADWTALEERRRVFWGAFCIDSQASVTTGWPEQIKVDRITTRLPSSEASFQQGREPKEPSGRLDDVLAGCPYSTFASTALVFHLFRSILAHVQIPDEPDKPDKGDKPDGPDGPDDPDGPFWKRHCDLDTKLSSAFVFLPEPFRLPQNMGDPIAVRTNLSLHAAVICLYHAVRHRADTHRLPTSVRKTSMDRLAAAAQEIVGILKATSCTSPTYAIPLSSLAMYCAASVLAYQVATGRADSSDAMGNIQFIMQRMEFVSHSNNFARAFLQQTVVDIKSSGLASLPAFYWLAKYARQTPVMGRSISVLCHLAVWGRSASTATAADEAETMPAEERTASSRLPSPEMRQVSFVEELPDFDPVEVSIEEELINARMTQADARLDHQWPYFGMFGST